MFVAVGEGVTLAVTEGVGEFGSKLTEREWTDRRLRARSGYPYD